MRRSGWIVAIVGLVAAVWLGIAVTAFVYRQEIFARIKGRPTHLPTPAKAFAMPLPAAPETLPFVGEEGVFPDGYPKKTASSVGMRALLRHRRFDALTSYIEQIEREALADFHKEYWALDAVQSFGSPDPALERLLDEWIARSPHSFAPYSARAYYRSQLGWHARGTKFARETSRAQFDALERYLKLARADAERALELNPNAVAPRFLLIDDARHSGGLGQKLAAALTRLPESFLARYFAMTVEKPRWGGSYAKMQAIADGARPHVAKNSRLAVLPGLVEIEKSRDLEDKKDFVGARAAVDRAFGFGEHWSFYEARGDARLRDGDAAGALADATQGLVLRPENTALLADRALALWKLRRFEEASDTFLQVLEIDPTHSRDNFKSYAGGFVSAGKKHARDGRPLEALRAFDKALLLEPTNAEAQRGRTELLARGDPSSNEAEVTTAVDRAHREDTFDAYLALDGVLARRGRFGEVIDHWTRYLEKHPNDGKAFLERGGAYTHIRRAPEAERDADSACKLGIPRGCELRTQMQEIQKRWRESAKK